MGGRPELVGLKGEERKSGVREMFDRISGRYDLLNHLLSGGMDVLWRRKAVRLLGVKAGEDYLDLATGTGDYAREILKHGPRQVIALDLAPKMLEILSQKAEGWPQGERVRCLQGDAEQLELPDACVDGVTIGFGIRNFPDKEKALGECARVLKPGGRLVILELAGIPNPLLNRLFGLYFKHVLPRIGALISGDAEAYTYLPHSVEAFPARDTFLGWMRARGFTNARCIDLTLGISSIFVGTRSAASASAPTPD